MELRLKSKVIESHILLIRGCRVMLDRDLAQIYGVSTGRLNEQVKRNRARFPEDFAFRLTKNEMQNWVSQNVIPNFWAKKGLRISPLAFTEHGAVAAAFVLNSSIAVAASIRIVRAFNRLRQIASFHKDLALALEELSRKVSGHDKKFKVLFNAIRDLMDPPLKPCRQIGFIPHDKRR